MPVIVADPCRENRESVATLLRLLDYDPITVDSRESLLDALESWGEAVVVTETFGDVYDLVEEIRRVNSGAEIILCTTQGSEEDTFNYKVLGLSYYIKPNIAAALLRHFRSIAA